MEPMELITPEDTSNSKDYVSDVTVNVDFRLEDLDEVDNVKGFLSQGCGCGCTLNDGGSFSRLFTLEFVCEFHNDPLMLQKESYESFNSLLAGYYSANRPVQNKQRTALWKINGHGSSSLLMLVDKPNFFQEVSC